MLAISLAGCSNSSQLSGRWTSTDANGQPVTLVLKSNGECEATAKGEHLTGKWSLDKNTTPNKLTLTFESKTVSSIVQVSGSSLLIEQIGENESGPLKFHSEKTAYYKREK